MELFQLELLEVNNPIVLSEAETGKMDTISIQIPHFNRVINYINSIISTGYPFPTFGIMETIHDQSPDQQIESRSADDGYNFYPDASF